MPRCSPIETFTKDPDETLDYEFDWSPWLAPDGDTLVSSQMFVPAGITEGPPPTATTATAVKFWLSGGVLWQEYKITNRVLTTQGRTAERSILVKVCER